MTPDQIADPVWRAVGVSPSDVLGVGETLFAGSTGATSASVRLITADLRDGSILRLVAKHVVPVSTGRHLAGSRSPDHWAYWRRELDAHRAGILPTGPGLRAPRLLAADGDTLYTEYVGEQRPSADRAAFELGRWHALDETPDLPWLAHDQLARRLAAGDLDWSDIDVDTRFPTIWARRADLMAQLDRLPRSITHGDAHLGNLRIDDTGVIALDWAAFGRSPAGFDLAHLALDSRRADLLPAYLDGLAGRYDPVAVALGYRIAVSLVGTSRVHWMTRRSVPVPADYAAFVTSHHP